MTNPVASFSGLASGIKWADIVDQLVALDESRTVTPIKTQIDDRTNEKTAWTTFQGLVEKMNDASRALRAGGIGGFTATAPVSPLTSRSLVGATATSTATPGTYKVEVLQLAQAGKVSGSAVTSATTALGLTGDFSLNGTTISVGASDTLTDIRTRINDANTGATPTGVTATILSDGTGGGRLILTRDSAGASGINLTDGTGGMARELGFIDSRSKAVSSTTEAIASAMGIVTSPPPASIRVGGRVISVDLSVDSIATVVAKINAAGGQASIASEPNGAGTGYKLMTDGNVTAVVGDANSQAVIDAMGFGGGAFGAVNQTAATGVFTTGADAAVTSSTLLTDLKIGGAATGIASGDAINIRGLRGDGTSVTIGITVGASDSLQTLVDKINDATSGFGSGARTAKATLGDDGRIRLTDNTGGESRLSLSLSVAKADGTAGTLGTPTLATIGRQREVAAGQDAQLRVDGVLLTRSSNTVTDAIGGVTLSLQHAEAGTSIDLTVDRNVTSAVTSVQAFADAYNNIVKFQEEQRQPGAPLYGSSTLRSTVMSFTDALRTNVTNNATYNRLSIAGVSLDRFGQVQVDSSTFSTALSSKPNEIEALFGLNGVGQAFVTATDNATSFGTGTISTQMTSIDDNVRMLQQRADDAATRLAQRRQALVEQYTAMETALSQLQSQGSFLTSAINGLQAGR